MEQVGFHNRFGFALENFVKQALLILLLVELLIFPLSFGQGQPMLIQGENFKLLFNSNSSLSFQNLEFGTVKLEITDGILNSSDNKLEVFREAGVFSFISLNQTRIKIIFPEGIDLSVTINETSISPLKSGTIISIINGDDVTIRWGYVFKVWIPITMGLGLLGFFMLIISPYYFIKKMKEGNLTSALCWGFLMFILGIAFVVVWLW